MAEPTNIDLYTLVYSKTEIDAQHAAETSRVNTALDSKINSSELGSPSGVSTLSPSGTHTPGEIPFSTILEANDDTNETTVINPKRLHYEIAQNTVNPSEVGAANGVAPLGADSIVPDLYLPPARTVKTYVVATLADRDLLVLTYTVLEGDRAIVTDEPTFDVIAGDRNGEYVANVDTPTSGDWSHLPNLSAVSSVNGQTGVVNITTITESAANAVDIAALDVRVGVNETGIAANLVSLGTKADQSALDTTNGNVATNTANIGTNTTDIGTNTSAISALDGRITSIEDSHTRILLASSTAGSQQPVATDTALQVEFGGLQSTTDIDISATGAITFKTAGKYIISPFFQYGRSGSVGTSILFNRILVNGVQSGASLGAKIDNADTLVPWSSSIQFTAAANDVVTIEIIRDSTGNDSGGLFAATPTAAGWNQAPCASLQIYRAI